MPCGRLSLTTPSPSSSQLRRQESSSGLDLTGQWLVHYLFRGQTHTLFSSSITELLLEQDNHGLGLGKSQMNRKKSKPKWPISLYKLGHFPEPSRLKMSPLSKVLVRLQYLHHITHQRLSPCKHGLVCNLALSLVSSRQIETHQVNRDK